MCSEIDWQIEKGEIFWIAIKSINLQNKVDKKLRNIYHIKDINTMEELAIRVKWYTNLKRTQTTTNPSPTKAEGEEERKTEKSPRPEHKQRRETQLFHRLNRKVSMVLAEMEKQSLTRLPTPRKTDTSMGYDLHKFLWFHNAKDNKIAMIAKSWKGIWKTSSKEVSKRMWWPEMNATTHHPWNQIPTTKSTTT